MSKLSRWWENSNERYHERTKFWKTLTRLSRVMMFAFIFLIFCCVGLIGTISDFRVVPWWVFAIIVVVPGLFAMCYAYVSTRIHWLWVFAIIPVQFVFYWVLNKSIEHVPSLGAQVPHTVANRLAWTSSVSILILTGSYTLILALFGREGRRYFRVHAEMQLASEIHKALVPPVQFTLSGFEVYGLSLPSGEVGGDLVDAVTRDGKWISYLADVSGHGVSSGVLMAMLKSATRMSMRNLGSVGAMLDEVNEVFYTLRAPNSFATFAAVSYTEQRGVEVLVAGHLPVLHCDGSSVTEIDTPGLPVGIMPESQFTTAQVEMRDGDVLAIVTDGLTEVFDKKEQELGSDYIKEALREHCGSPLDEIAKVLLARAASWGKRSDDQSLLLVRRLGGGGNSRVLQSNA